MSVAEKVKEIIVDQLGVDAGEVNPEAKFVDDLGADSLDLTELIMAMEEEFGVEISDEDAQQIQKVQDAISFIEKKKFDYDDMEIVVIGKHSHPEIIGTVGQLENTSKVHIVSDLSEAKLLNFPSHTKVGFVTQTTLSHLYRS